MGQNKNPVLIRQCTKGFTLVGQVWIGPMIFKNFAVQVWIGFKFHWIRTGLGLKKFTVRSSLLISTHNHPRWPGFRSAGDVSGRILRFCPHPGQESQIFEKRPRIWSHFSISAVAEVCVVISKVKPLLTFACFDCSRSRNKEWDSNFEKFPDPDPDLKPFGTGAE